MSSADLNLGFANPPEPGLHPPLPMGVSAGYAWDKTPPPAPGGVVEERLGEAPPIALLPTGSSPTGSSPTAPSTTTEVPTAELVCDDDEQRERGWLTSAPPLLASAIVHMLVMIVLGLWILAPDINKHIRVVLSTSEGEPQTDDLNNVDITDEPLEPLLPQALDDPTLPELDEPPSTTDLPIPEFDAPGITTNTAINRPDVSRMLAGRSAGMKQAYLDLYGGTAATEAAVVEGLKWLARTQERRNGRWKLQNGSESRNEAAATAMALLAYLGAGETDRRGAFQKNVERGFRALLKMQNSSGQIRTDDAANNHTFYTHAIATIALCEMYALTGDAKYLGPAERAVAFAIATQTKEGGWKYKPGKKADLSVTGWMMMALQSARMAGLEVPEKTLDGIEKYLDTTERSAGDYYVYENQDRAHTSPALDAVGLLGRQYFGAKRDDPTLLRALDRLLATQPMEFAAGNRRNAGHDVYYWYYVTQVAHHAGGERWKEWNDVMRVELPKHQTTDGRHKGSWNPDNDRWGFVGGRHSVTCLSLYMLEVYYRHLPLYSLDGRR